MATSYKIKLRRFNGADYDTLNLLSDNIIMGNGSTLQSIIPSSNGMVKINNGIFQTAVAGTDYLTPATNYSTVNGISANYSLVANDIGKTIRIAATGDVRITFTSEVSSSMGNGAEIAFVKLTPNITVTIDMSETGGCYGFVDGEAKTFSVFRLANAYELAAVKKIYGDVNRWLVQGNVEVVS